MSRIEDVFQTSSSEPEAWTGTISKDVTDANELASVILPAFSSGHSFEMTWPIYDGSLPQKGDPVVVLFPREGEPWIAAWRPASPTSLIDRIQELEDRIAELED